MTKDKAIEKAGEILVDAVTAQVESFALAASAYHSAGEFIPCETCTQIVGALATPLANTIRAAKWTPDQVDGFLAAVRVDCLE